MSLTDAQYARLKSGFSKVAKVRKGARRASPPPIAYVDMLETRALLNATVVSAGSFDFDVVGSNEDLSKNTFGSLSPDEHPDTLIWGGTADVTSLDSDAFPISLGLAGGDAGKFSISFGVTDPENIAAGPALGLTGFTQGSLTKSAVQTYTPTPNYDATNNQMTLYLDGEAVAVGTIDSVSISTKLVQFQPVSTGTGQFTFTAAADPENETSVAIFDEIMARTGGTGKLTFTLNGFDYDGNDFDYGEDASLYSSSGTFQNVTVKDGTTVALTGPENPQVGQKADFTAIVSVNEGGTGSPTGKVEFYDDDTLLGSGTIRNVAGQFTATFSTSNLSGGEHSITAVYVGDNGFDGSTSDDFDLVVGKADTTVKVTSSAGTSVYGQKITLTATLSNSGTVSPTGMVNFFDGEALIGEGTISVVNGKSTATLTIDGAVVPFLAPGEHAITAGYTGNDSFNVAVSTAITQKINPAKTTTKLTSTDTTADYGQLITFTATVGPVSPSSGTPTGNVTFLVDGHMIGVKSLEGNQATLSLNAAGLPFGSYSVTAIYNGDDNFSTSTSAKVAEKISQAKTTVTVVGSDPVTFGTGVTFTATVAAVSPGEGDLSGGAVTFKIGSNTFNADGTAVVDGKLVATYSTAALPVGVTSVTASYAGNANFTKSTSAVVKQTVTKDDSTTTVASDFGTSVYGQPVTLTATITPANGGIPTGTVTFKEIVGTKQVTLGTAKVAPDGNTASFTTSKLAAGDHEIVAVYSGDKNVGASTSAPLAQTVNKADTTIAITSSAEVAVIGSTVTLTATVNPVAPGTGVPTGTVTFFNDELGQFNVKLVNGKATLKIPTKDLLAGDYIVTAAYAGDVNYGISASGDFTQTLTTTALTSSKSSSVYGQPVTFTATLAGLTPATPAQRIQLFDATNSENLVELSTKIDLVVKNGKATVKFDPTAKLGVGTHTIVAKVYDGDGNEISELSSTVVTQTITMAKTTTKLTSTDTTADYGQLITFTATVGPVSPSSGTPTGNVTFQVNGQDIPGIDPVELVDGQATISLNAADYPFGSYSVTAVYSGDDNFSVSTSAKVAEKISQAKTTITVTSGESSPEYGDGVTFTATVESFLVEQLEDEQIVFKDGSKILGYGYLGVDGTVTYTAYDLSVGSHSITASYAGSANYAKSTSKAFKQTVIKESSTTTLVPSDPSVYGQPVTLIAMVNHDNDFDALTGTVTFKEIVGSKQITLGTAEVAPNGIASFTTSKLATGDHEIVAVYSGDKNVATSISGDVTQTVGKADTAIAVTSSSGVAVVGSTVTLTATVNPVAPGSGVPTGIVTFSIAGGDDGLVEVPVKLVNGKATLNIPTKGHSPGAYVAVASYSGDDSYESSTSATPTELVLTTTSLASSKTSVPYGQPVTFTATLNGASDGQTVQLFDATDPDPENWVELSDKIDVVVKNGKGTVKFDPIADLGVGTHTIVAQVFEGEDPVSFSAVVMQTVTAWNTTVAVTSNVKSPAFGDEVTFTAKIAVAKPGTGFATGTVQFFDGGAPLGGPVVVDSNANGVATYTTTAPLDAGTHKITAVFTADQSKFADATSKVLSQIVSQAKTTITVDGPDESVAFGQPATFIATVDLGDLPVDQLEGEEIVFKDGSKVLGSGFLGEDGKVTFETSALSVGSHSITASYAGNANFAKSTSKAIKQVVTKDTSTTLLASNSIGGTSVYGQPVTLTATIIPTQGAIPTLGIPTGTVTFKEIVGTKQVTLGTAKVGADGKASFTTSKLATGSHSIVAVYGGDTNVGGSSSNDNEVAPLDQTVNLADTAIEITSSKVALAGSTVTLTATVNPTSPGTGVPTGTVTFSGDLGQVSVKLVNGKATLKISTKNFLPDDYSVTVSYSGDGKNYNAADDVTFTETLTTTTLTTSKASVPYGQPVTFTATLNGASDGQTVQLIDATDPDPENWVELSDKINVVVKNGKGTVKFDPIADLDVGTHTIVAQVFEGEDLVSSSTVVTQTVTAWNTTVTVTSDPKAPVLGEYVYFMAKVAVAKPGTGPAAGTVQFYDGDTLLGSDSVDEDGEASFWGDSFSVGTHKITAVFTPYGGSPYGASTSKVLSLNVSSKVKTGVEDYWTGVFDQDGFFADYFYDEAKDLDIYVMTAGGDYDLGMTFWATSGDLSELTVTFKDGSKAIGNSSLEYKEDYGGYYGHISASDLSVGKHTITAVLNGNAQYPSKSYTFVVYVTAPIA